MPRHRPLKSLPRLTGYFYKSSLVLNDDYRDAEDATRPFFGGIEFANRYSYLCTFRLELRRQVTTHTTGSNGMDSTTEPKDQRGRMSFVRREGNWEIFEELTLAQCNPQLSSRLSRLLEWKCKWKWKCRLQVTGRPLSKTPAQPYGPPSSPPLLSTGLGPWTRYTMGFPLWEFHLTTHRALHPSPQCRAPDPRTDLERLLGFNGQLPLPDDKQKCLLPDSTSMFAPLRRQSRADRIQPCVPRRMQRPSPEPWSHALVHVNRLHAPSSMLGNGPSQ